MSSDNKNFSLTEHNVVCIDYASLEEGADLHEAIETAYGLEGLGILVVSNIPGFVEARQNLLPLARTFANLPDEAKAKTELPETSYSFGWSHGKEKFKGRADTMKGSYYANPEHDRPVDDEELIKAHPHTLSPNVWPDEDLPELEPAFKELGQLITRVGKMVATHCDNFVHDRTDKYEEGRLLRQLQESLACKARLLHYFPQYETAEDADKQEGKEDAQDSEPDYASWCGWHLDHGSITGLTCAMYIDHDGNEVECPDPEAGLYIETRDGSITRVVFPPDMLAFQIGECAQIQSGGRLRATPHCVRGAQGPKAVGVSRNTLAVFMEPNFDWTLDLPESGEDPQINDYEERDPPMTFGDFDKIRIAQYYS